MTILRTRWTVRELAPFCRLEALPDASGVIEHKFDAHSRFQKEAKVAELSAAGKTFSVQDHKARKVVG